MKAETIIRKALEQDITCLSVLSSKVWLATYAKEGVKPEYANFVVHNFNTESFLQDINSLNKTILVAEQEGILQGYLLANRQSHYQDQSKFGYEIERLYIDTQFKGQGIGKALLQRCQNELGPKFWLYTWVENDANDFYKHLGLINIGQLTFDFHGVKIQNWVYTSVKLA
ncbi:GNAT family N-acetyltransferase [Pseudoalteromonas phenolica]|uniref:GNAT family N-acetyltransferase n=1 Tax=Pseudoalteromonas phenolica TaxID=161398 RepID=UPI001F0F55E9|nr:GNAT family N-acetyltransferase [Pseudoalteromonas phenolica]